MFGLFLKSNYDRSQSVTSVNFSVSREARRIINQLLVSESASERQQLSESLLDELSDCAMIDIVELTIADKRQAHSKKNGKLVYKRYGFYRPDKKSIYITNKTAVREKPLAPKTFLDTLLHEWIHHYDYARLGIRSIHTKGFYLRLRDLKVKLGLLD